MGRPPRTPRPDSAFYVRLEDWGMRRLNTDQITLRKLAELLEVPLSNLGAWKTATNRIERDTARRLSEKTGIPWSELLELRDQLEEQVVQRKRDETIATLRGRDEAVDKEIGR